VKEDVAIVEREVLAARAQLEPEVVSPPTPSSPVRPDNPDERIYREDTTDSSCDNDSPIDLV